MQRLQQWKQFQAVMSASKVWRSTHFAIHQWQPDTTQLEALQATTGLVFGDLVVGAVTPKRWAKRAVTRHLLKRQILTVFENYVSVLPPTAYVVRLHSSFDVRRYVSAASPALKLAARQELTQLFIKLTAS